jgi:hypothetical protein
MGLLRPIGSVAKLGPACCSQCVPGSELSVQSGRPIVKKLSKHDPHELLVLTRPVCVEDTRGRPHCEGDPCELPALQSAA